MSLELVIKQGETVLGRLRKPDLIQTGGLNASQCFTKYFLIQRSNLFELHLDNLHL